MNTPYVFGIHIEFICGLLFAYGSIIAYKQIKEWRKA